jgi:hypothetical protein
MKLTNVTLSTLLVLAATTASAEWSTSFEQSKSTYDAGEEPEYIQIASDDYDITTAFTTEGNQSMVMDFKADNTPVIVWNWGGWTWTPSNILAVDVCNPTGSDLELEVKLLDKTMMDNGDWGNDQLTASSSYVIPDGTSQVKFNLDGSGAEFWGTSFNAGNVGAVQFLLPEGASVSAATLYFDYLRVNADGAPLPNTSLTCSNDVPVDPTEPDSEIRVNGGGTSGIAVLLMSALIWLRRRR